MVFSSLEFLFAFLPLTLILYFIVPHKWRNPVLLAVSLLFYGWGEPVYVLLMVFTILVDYVMGYFVARWRSEDKKRAKRFLIAAVVINLGLLAFFKYCDFIIGNLAQIPFLSFLKPLNIPLPIGISFYTFQSLSYVIDIYRGETDAQKNLAAFGAYVTLFPQLIAGPIVRYRDIDDQLTDRRESISLFSSGVRTFTAGLCKKVLLANTAGLFWESVRSAPSRSVITAWVGILFYSFQLYFDFSAYSDMAIGLGKMFGFRFLENFNYPYISRSITEFWRRWHISLSTWFREYVYIPLGGNRCSVPRMYLNLFVVWLCTGIWHGASWNFVIWGLYYFVLLVAEKAFLLKFLEKLPAFFRHLYALFFIVIGWLIFDFVDTSAGLSYLGTMFGIGSSGFFAAGDAWELLRHAGLFCLMVIAATPLPKKVFWALYEKLRAFRYAVPVFSAALIGLSVAYLVNSSYNPFLYFRF